MSKIERLNYDIRLTLSMPFRGRVIIEGGQKTVLEFWQDVKHTFTDEITASLQSGQFAQGDSVPIKIEKKPK
jgi:hypothetical protein